MTGKAYLELVVTVADESREALVGRLMDIGSTGIIEGEGRLTAYFDSRTNPREIEADLGRLRRALAAAGLDAEFSFELTHLPEQDWNESWKSSFTPIDVGATLTIIPSWLQREITRIPIIVDPGMVFGTGHHETTRRCLMLLERLSKTFRGGSFLDIGTGTGILAIAAARLGLAKVVAVDTDPLCVEAAGRNCALNSLSAVAVLHGSVSDVEGSFDLIAANLLSEILIGIAPEIGSHLNRHGVAVLSGIIEGQEDGVVRALEAAGLALRETHRDGTWITLVAVHEPLR